MAVATVAIWQKQRETDAAYHEAQQQRQEADEQRQIANEQRQEAIANLKDAHPAVDQFLSRLGQGKYVDVEQWRRPLRTDALRFYQKFLQRTNVDKELRLDAARAHINAGAIQLRLGESDKAMENMQKGIAIAKELAAGDPGQPDYQHVLASG